MSFTQKIPEENIRLPDDAIAELLGISLSEFHALSYKPLEAFRDLKGNIIEFYMQISTNNDPEVLEKLNPDQSNFIRFAPGQILNRFSGALQA